MASVANTSENRPDTVKVMTTGVFDLLHPGHVHMLEEAAKLGDELVVVIARDESVTKEKHAPITPEGHRQHMVQALKPVTKAVLGHRGDYYQIVEEEKPDVFALGFDQDYDEARIQGEFDKRGIACKVVRLPEYVGDLQGTRKIIEKISARMAEDSLYNGQKKVVPGPSTPFHLSPPKMIADTAFLAGFAALVVGAIWTFRQPGTLSTALLVLAFLLIGVGAWVGKGIPRDKLGGKK